MPQKPAVTTSVLSKDKAQILLERISKKEQVSVEERFVAIQHILAFSPRDRSTDPELWLMYQVAFNDGSENENCTDLRSTKLQKLAESNGYKNGADFAEGLVKTGMGTDSLVPGICMNSSCDHTTECEPDAENNYCDSCGQNSVQSVLNLL